MDAPSLVRAKEWLHANRGDETQDKLAADITRVTGWKITRDRYSKYEGRERFGRVVLGHFIEYWASRGRPGPFDALPEPATATETPDPVVAAIDRQTAMLERVLTAIVKRLPLAEDPETARVLADLAGFDLAVQRESASLPQSPLPARPDEGRRSGRQSDEVAG